LWWHQRFFGYDFVQLVARDGDRHCYSEGACRSSSEEELHLGAPVLSPNVEKQGFGLCVQARLEGAGRIFSGAVFVAMKAEALPFAKCLGIECVHGACSEVGRVDFGLGVVCPFLERVVALILSLVADNSCEQDF
jgi:hypothetical protein